MHQNRQHLLGDLDDRHQFLGRIQRKLDVNRNNDIDVHLLHDINGQIGGDATIDKQATVDVGWREYGRHRHAGSNGQGQVALSHDVSVPGFDIGRDRPERNRQLVEIADL